MSFLSTSFLLRSIYKTYWYSPHGKRFPLFADFIYFVLAAFMRKLGIFIDIIVPPVRWELGWRNTQFLLSFSSNLAGCCLIFHLNDRLICYSLQISTANEWRLSRNLCRSQMKQKREEKETPFFLVMITNPRSALWLCSPAQDRQNEWSVSKPNF